MTDIDTSVEFIEDTRLFTELTGQAASIQYELANLIVQNIGEIAFVAFVLFLFALVLCWMTADWLRISDKAAVVIVIGVPIVITAVAVLAIYVSLKVGLECDLASVDAQLESLYIRHPEWRP